MTTPDASDASDAPDAPGATPAPDEGKPARGLRDLDDIDAVFGALAHATRRHILQVLHARDGSLSAGELSARFAHSWPTTTRHLGVLLDAGLVAVTPVGRERRYEIARERLADTLGLWLHSVGLELGSRRVAADHVSSGGAPLGGTDQPVDVAGPRRHRP